MINRLLQTLQKIRSANHPPVSSTVERAFGDRISEDQIHWRGPDGRDPAQALPVRIRAMQIEDLSQVHAIDAISFSMPWPLSSYRFELLENPASMLWVAEIDSAEIVEPGTRAAVYDLDAQPKRKQILVGMVVVWMIMEEAHIATIAVHPDYRGCGIGRLLLAHSLREAVLKRATQATLEVRASNVVAQNLYHRFGFQIVGRRPKYYQDNYEDALIMTAFNLNGERMDKLAQET